MENRSRKIWLVLAVGCALALAPAVRADLEEDIEASVVAGLAWLAEQQQAGGNWESYSNCDDVGVTGLAVLKFEDRALDLGYDPLDPGYEYYEQVQGGLDFLAANAHTQAITVQTAGDPDGDGDGIGVYFTPCPPNYHPVYQTGIAMMALAASQHPELYGDLLQDAVDWMAWVQVDIECGVHRGGWHYVGGCDSDNSNTGYATLGLGFAEAAPPFGFGLTVPQFVKDELSIWADVIQDDVNGDPDDGGSWYNPGWDWYPWVNILKTGNLIYEMGLVGDDATTPRVMDAVDYIERHWYDPGYCDPGWMDHRQAMFTMMKGFESLGIEEIDVGSEEAPDIINWFEVVANHLIDTQDPDGWWPADCWGGTVLSTAWALLTLEKAVPTFEIPVPVDIKPTSCRNPFNVAKKGLVPVAILGTEDLDVTQVDPASVMLAGISPIRWALEDVATPFEPYLGKMDAFDCTEEGPDGYMDLTFKFSGPELAAALGPVADGDVIVVPLMGNLLEEFGGTPIVGEDVIVILK